MEMLPLTSLNKGNMTVKQEVEAPKTREEILQMSLDARVQEVMHYQINIDNYTIALDRIAALPAADQSELASFTDQLRTLLASEKLEQKKAKIMLEVVKQQIGT